MVQKSGQNFLSFYHNSRIWQKDRETVLVKQYKKQNIKNMKYKKHQS